MEERGGRGIESQNIQSRTEREREIQMRNDTLGAFRIGLNDSLATNTIQTNR